MYLKSHGPTYSGIKKIKTRLFLKIYIYNKKSFNIFTSFNQLKDLMSKLYIAIFDKRIMRRHSEKLKGYIIHLKKSDNFIGKNRLYVHFYAVQSVEYLFEKNLIKRIKLLITYEKKSLMIQKKVKFIHCSIFDGFI